MTTETRHPSPVLRVVREVEDSATLHGPVLPWDSELAAAYGGRDALLLALHQHWSRQLLSRIDVALELGAETPEASVAVAWRSALRDQPGVHRLLEAESDNPALRAARRSLLATVAVAAGRATFDDPASVSVAAGARFLASVDESGVDVHRRSRLARAAAQAVGRRPDARPVPLGRLTHPSDNPVAPAPALRRRWPGATLADPPRADRPPSGVVAPAAHRPGRDRAPVRRCGPLRHLAERRLHTRASPRCWSARTTAGTS